MNRQQKRIIASGLGLILGVVIGLGWMWQPQTAPPAPAETNPLQTAWDFSQTVGTYRFTADAQQTLIPRPLPTMIGQTDARVDMHIEGDVNLPDETKLSISLDGAGLDSTPVTLVQNGAQSYLLKNGEKTPISNNPATLAAPTGDYLSYLAAAENIQPCAVDGPPLPDTSACYTYSINGQKFAAYVRDKIKAELEANPAMLPPGVTANPQISPELMKMSGQGKVWLNADNLPVRMTVDLAMPEINPAYDAKVKMVINYTFDAAAVEQAKEVAAPAQLPGFGHGSLPDMSGWLMFAIALIPFGLLVIFQRRRWMYGLVVTGVIFSMVSVPLVQAASYTRFFERQAQAADVSQAFADMISPQAAEPAPPSAMPVQPLSPYEQIQLATQAQPDSYCGKGGNGDTDGDGLSDAAEYCLGTDPTLWDSDHDMLSDGLEVNGAQIPVLQGGTTITQTWFSNPLNPDSNGDGRNDNFEWASGAGLALNWDLDKDGVPNLWDFDDDGDGVPDVRDLSPASYTSLITDTKLIKREVTDPNHCGLFDFSGCSSKPITTTILNLTDSYDGYTYISFQIQPKDKDHLRYGMTPLDWGYDDKGQIKDLNGSKDDIRLIPMLSVQTNTPPDSALAQQYNVTVLKDTDGDGYSEMTIPLNMVGANGASVEAFSARMAYGPGALKNLKKTGIVWKDARLVWTVQGKIDSENKNGKVTEKTSPLQTYVEPAFRITGLEVTKSGTFRSAILGTPNSPDDDRQLFQLLFGLSSTFLTHRQPDLDEIKTRFSGTNTPIEQKWGVTTTVAIDLPATPDAHLDVGMAAINDRINSFINDHYTSITNTVIIATEMSSGASNMDELFDTNITLPVDVNLNDISLSTQRTLSLNMRDGWKPVSDNNMAKAVLNRYKTVADAAVTDLKDQYPSITASELLALTVVMYSTWEGGRTRSISFDGTNDTSLSRSDTEVYNQIFVEPRDRYNDPTNIRTLPGYLVEAGHFARQGGGLSFAGGGAQVWQYLNANAQEAYTLGFTAGTAGFFSTVDQSLLAGLGGKLTFGSANWNKVVTQSVFDNREDYNYSKSFTGNALGVADGARDLGKIGVKRLAAFEESVSSLRTQLNNAKANVSKGKTAAQSKILAKRLAKVQTRFSSAAKKLKVLKTLSKYSGEILLGLDIAFSIGFFFASGDFSGQAIAMLIAQIIFSIMMYVISTIPPWIGTVITIVLGLIDLFLMIFGSSFSISGWVTKQIAKYVYDEKPLTEIDDFKLLGRGMKLANQDMGYIPGNRLIISDTFKGSIKLAGTKGFLKSLEPSTDDWVVMGLTGGAGAAFVMAQKIDVTGKLQKLFGVGMSDPDGLLRKSWICGEFTVAGWTNTNKKADVCPLKYPNYNLKAIPKNAKNWQYENPMNITVFLDKAGSNLKIPLQLEITAQTVNDASTINPVGFGLLGRIHWEKTRRTNLPGDMPKDDKKKMSPQDIYLDVLPKTVGDLWTWNDKLIVNHDPDGDGMTTEDEITARLGSKAYDEIAKLIKPYLADKNDFGVERFLAHWDANESSASTVTSAVCAAHTDWASLCSSTDSPFWLKWDSDGDGLSDKFEYDHSGKLGTDATKYDTDGDGLNDGLEFAIGTSIKDKDSDSDGLTDAQEVYHKNETTGNWEGGWDIVLPKVGGYYTTTVHVVSDPLKKDTDGDGITDAAEKKLGTSPTAFNRAPKIWLTADPVDTSPSGVRAMYMKPGDPYTLTARIEVYDPFTVSQTLSLQIPGNVLSAEAQTPGLNGSRSIPNVGTTVNPRWSFATQVLQPGYYEYGNSKGYAALLSASDVGTATLTLPFRASTLEDSQLIVVDAERPTFRMLKPRTGQLIGGGVTDYVIGGYSDDVTTWVDHIKMELPGIGWQTVASRSTSLSPWAYTWNLPADGVHTLQGFAQDFVGNNSYADSVEVMVDNTAPSVTVNLTDGTVYGPPKGSDVITITLNGTANDNYSGLTRVQISTDDGPWREVWRLEDATPTNTTYSTFSSNFANIPTGATWDAVWTLPNVKSVQGYHSLRIRAFDKAGNWPQYTERNIIVDVLPPTSELTNRAYLYNPPNIPANVSRTFDGVANDVGNVPQPSRPAELAGTLDALNDATIWLGFDSITEDDGGVNVQWIGDFNGDRRKDLLVGLPAADGGNGRVSIVYGRSGNWPVPNARELLADSQTSFVGVPGAGIGLNVMPAGDFNGDGRADMLIGDPANNRVFLVFGQPFYLGKDVPLNGTKKQSWVVLTPPAGEQIGNMVAPAGDVNGDGFADIFIGTTGASGSTYVVGGQPLPAWETMPLDSYAMLKISNTVNAKSSVAGDLDGDFRDEFAVSTGNTVYLFRGSGTYAPQAGAWLSTGSAVATFASADALPQIAALGDVTGDHKDDFIYTDGGNQHVVFGDSNLGDGVWTTKDYTLGAGFVAAAGDVDVDGLDDILIGGGSTAYLILGSSTGLGGAKATINGVTAAASAPFAINADLNSDASSDLLLIPAPGGAQADGQLSEAQKPDIPPMWVPHPNPPQLKTYSSSNTYQSYVSADAYVSASGDCHGQAPCYSTIQAAVDARFAGDLIIVQPGVYAPFTINGKNNMTVQGMDTDAVFMDGAGGTFAAKIIGATGVNLKNMTLRNAGYGVQLDDAGLNGYKTSALANRTILDHLLIYDVTVNDVYMSRTSTVTITRSTLVRNNNHIGVYGAPDAGIPSGWTSKGPTTWPIYDGGDAVAMGNNVYMVNGGGGSGFHWYDADTENWGIVPWGPSGILEPGSAIAAGSDGQVYLLAGAGWDNLGGGLTDEIQKLDFNPANGHVFAVPFLGDYLAEWNGSTWVKHTGLANANQWNLTVDYGTGHVFVMNGTDGVMDWDPFLSTWTNVTTETVQPLESYSDTLYAGRYLGPGQYEVAKMNVHGGGWQTVIPNLDGSVTTLELDEKTGTLYVGGDFTDRVKQVNVNSGSTTYIGNPGSVITSGTVYDIAFDEFTGDIYACGDIGGSGIAKYDGSNWTKLPLIGGDTSGICYDVAYKGDLYAVGRWYDTVQGWRYVARWNGSSWKTYDADWYPNTMAATNQGIYIGGPFTQMGDTGSPIAVSNVARIHASNEVYSPTANAWSSLTLPAIPQPGASYAGDDSGNLYFIQGGGSSNAFKYNIASQTWTKQALPGPVNASAMTQGYGGSVRALIDGGKFYVNSGSNWNDATGIYGLSPATAVITHGVSLAYDPKRDDYYALPGGNGIKLLKLDGTIWSDTGQNTPGGVGAGGSLVYVPVLKDIGGAALYAVRGGNTADFWQYPLPEPNKVGFERTAIVAPSGTSWLNLTDPLPADFNFRVGTGNQFIGGYGWTPTNDTTLPQTTTDPFLDSTRNIYRMKTTGWDVGYHTYVAPMTATTTTGIQSVLNSGANQVVVEPGIYKESLYLPSGVTVIGGNAEWTIIRPPSGGSDPLVRIEGATGASLSHVMLDAQGSGRDGLVVGGGATYAGFDRSIVSEANTGIVVDGAGTDVAVSNVTVARNVNGLNATNCASVDVRNSVFAYHTGAGLSYQTCAATKLHTYNLFWQNGSDFGVNATAGAGELFLDPIFVDPTDNDYRTVNYSPVIDAGNPTDPAPPGSGNRADIGYVEQGRANFYVDASYCPLCVNDGLTWQVDAFSTIQDALDEAKAILGFLRPGADFVPQLTVGVAPGTYTEQVTVPSHVLLLGSGAEVTTLNTGGSGSAVTFDGVSNSTVAGFTLTGGTGVNITGAANNVVVYRNIIHSNTVGVGLSNRATAQLSFNTVVNNTVGVSATGAGVWARVAGNIMSGNGTGFSAASNGQMYSDYNLLFNTTDYSGVAQGTGDVTGQDPQFGGGAPYRLTAASPALDIASPNAFVPEGGGIRADAGYSELLAPPISLMLGKEDLSTVMGNSGVASVEYSIVPVADNTQPVTATLPSGGWQPVTLASPGATVSYWQTTYTPTAEGVYRFYSRATDMVGNQETDEKAWFEGSFIADSTPPTVQWLAPANGTSTVSPIELRAQVSDYAAGQWSVDENNVHFVVDGVTYPATWAAEPWLPDGSPRVFRAWITPTVAAHNNVVAYAEDQAGNNATDNSVSFTITGPGPTDISPPSLAILRPVYGGWVTHTVTFSGTVSDGESGVASVEVSVDGGVTFRPATITGTIWSLTWDGPANQSFVSYPMMVRAKDRSGNVTTTPWLFTIDEIPPRGLPPVSFNAPEGTHFDTAPNLSINWNTPLDGSGIITTLLTVDQITDTIPADVVTGTSAVRTFNGNGEWYVHLGAMDAAGNMTALHFGPWYVGIDDGVAFSQQQQSIQVDGYIDVRNGEWRSGEFLDNDERPVGSNVTYSPNTPQAFYTAWDANNFYLAWHGGYWAMDGALWVYLNTGAGGNSQFIAPIATAPTALLPFAANYAIEITDPLTGTLWEYNGSNWQVSADSWAFAQGPDGDTEIKLPLYGTSNIETLAFGLGDDGNVWAVFPATNPLNPAGSPIVQQVTGRIFGLAKVLAATGGWQAYSYPDITTAASPAANQPQAVSAEIAVSTPQSPATAWGPGNTLQYVVQLTNREDYTLTNQSLSFLAVPSGALIHDSITGATCPTTNPWTCTVAEAPPGTSVITLTTHLVSNLTGITDTTMYIDLQNSSIPPEMVTQGKIVHQMDNEPPEITVDSAPFVYFGTQSMQGTTFDAGIGVDYVEIQPEGGSWQRAVGTEFWTGDVTVSPFAQNGDIVRVFVRAVDKFGQVSPTKEVTFTVDLQPPAVTLSSPAAVSGAFSDIAGVASDQPSGNEAASVFVEVDGDPWREATPFAADGNGDIPFRWTWNLPTEDGITHTIRVRATDTVGNDGYLNPVQTIMVDNVAPVLTATQALTEVVVQNYRPGVTWGIPVLTGTVTDGGGMQSLWVQVEEPDGNIYDAAATLSGNTWAYTPTLTLTGTHYLRPRAIDTLGNTTYGDTFNLHVIAAPDAASNTFTTPEDTPFTFTPLFNDVDLDSTILMITAVSTPTFGTSVITGTTQLIYTPPLNFNGTDVFTYTVSDEIGLVGTATITVTVTPVNDTPVITPGGAISVTMSEDGSPLPFALTLDALDVDNDVLTWTVSVSPTNGTAAISGTTGITAAAASIAYTPTLNFNGVDTFTVQVSDGALTDTIGVSVTVEAVNDAPVAVPDTLVALRTGNAVQLLATSSGIGALNVLANDSDVENSPLSVTIVGQPSQGGAVTIDALGNLTGYTPTTTFTGTETFTYTVSDGSLSDTGTVVATVVDGQGGGSAGETFTATTSVVSGTITTTVIVPPAAPGAEPLALVFTETVLTGNPPAGLAFAGFSFALEAYVNGQYTSPYTFTAPITVTIDYSGSPIAGSRDEGVLDLRYWDGTAWRRDGITIVMRDTINHRLTFTLAHLTPFAMVVPQYQIYLPLVMK